MGTAGGIGGPGHVPFHPESGPIRLDATKLVDALKEALAHGDLDTARDILQNIKSTLSMASSLHLDKAQQFALADAQTRVKAIEEKMDEAEITGEPVILSKDTVDGLKADLKTLTPH